MVGEDDQITMQNNYIYRTAGRSPALSENTLLHAVNNVWEDNNGHAIEGGSDNARGIFEGNAFINVRQLVSDYSGRLFTTPNGDSTSECELAFGRPCEVNLLEESQGDFNFVDTSFFSEYSEYEIAPAVSAEEAKKSVPANAGAGKIDTSGDAKSSGQSVEENAKVSKTSRCRTSFGVRQTKSY
jgi:pectate lyase